MMARHDCSELDELERPCQQQRTRDTTCWSRSLLELGLPQSLFTAPPASSSPFGTATVPKAGVHRSSSSSSNSISSSSSSSGCSSLLTGCEMIRHRSLDESGGSSSSSSSNPTRSTTARRRPRVPSTKDGSSSWVARSKLPFHMLPSEVQAYHLQQQHLKQRLHGNRNNSGICNGTCSASSASPATLTDDESAMVESAWFPLMPPAMAGESQPGAAAAAVAAASAASCWQQCETDGTGDCILDPCRAEQQLGDGRATSRSHQPGDVEGCLTSMTGAVVHLAASLHPRGGPESSTTSAATSFATWTSVGSSGESDDGEDGQLPVWASPPLSPRPSLVPLGESPSPRPLLPFQPVVAATTTAAIGEATATTAGVTAAGPAAADRRPLRSAPVGDLGGSPPQDSGGNMNKALTLAALSGFVQGGGAASLQQVSLGLSNACRTRATWFLRVTGKDDEGGEDNELPPLPPQLADYLWPGSSLLTRKPSGDRDGRGGGGGGGGGVEDKGEAGAEAGRADTAQTWTASGGRLRPHRRITRVEIEGDVRGVTWALWPPTMRRLEFGARFNSPVEGMSLPEGVETVRFGAAFNQPVSRVRWPRSLRELVFGNDFNQPVSGIGLPAGLRLLDFGGRFNFAISAVDFPEELRELRLGHGFNREIACVRWPPRLSKLVFCGELQQRIEDISLPPTLTHLALLGDFDQPIHAVQWPPGLRTVRFGDHFRQPVSAAAWPASLLQLVVGRGYDKVLPVSAARVWRFRPKQESSGRDVGHHPLLLPSPPSPERRLLLPSAAGGGGGGGGRGAGEGGGAFVGLPPSCEVLLRVCGDDTEDANVVGDGDDGDDDDSDDGLNDGDGLRRRAMELAGPAIIEADGGWRGGEDAVRTLDRDGIVGAVDNDEDDDDNDGLDGLPYCWAGEEGVEDEEATDFVDVFEFENGSLDVGGSCPPGSYDSDTGISSISSISSRAAGLMYL